MQDDSNNNNNDNNNNCEEQQEQNEESLSNIAVSMTESPSSIAQQQRLRRLKQKMNQARQLNRQAVQEEGENMLLSLSSGQQRGGGARKNDNTSKKHPSTGGGGGGKEKYLTQQASEAISKREKKEENAILNQYHIKDYHNPQGQYRNYLRNLKSLPKGDTVSASATTDATYNPLQFGDDAAEQQNERLQREGAHRLASELKRRIEKQQKRKQTDSDKDQTGGINKRNKLYIQQISKDYDKHTKEIKQNLERGTAL